MPLTTFIIINIAREHNIFLASMDDFQAPKSTAVHAIGNVGPNGVRPGGGPHDDVEAALRRHLAR